MQNLFSDPMTLIIIAVLIVLIFFMFRNGRKRRAQMQELQSKVVPGAEVITQSGIIGTILSMDDEAGKVALETTPGTVITVHRQTVTTVLTPVITEEVAPEPEQTQIPGDDLIEDSKPLSLDKGDEGADGPSDAPEK